MPKFEYKWSGVKLMPTFEYEWSGVNYEYGSGRIVCEDEEKARDMLEERLGFAFDELEIGIEEVPEDTEATLPGPNREDEQML